MPVNRWRHAAQQAFPKVRQQSPGLTFQALRAMRTALPGIDALSARKRFVPNRVIPKPNGEVPVVYGVEPSYLAIANLRIVSGRFFTDDESVGGIGIMNVMLASVLERTPEIGLRRALGARRIDINRQFVIETTLIAVTGGVLGLILGVTMSRAIAEFAGWSTIVTPGALALSFLVSVAIGLLFGVYPATKAAGLDPVEALRYE